MSESVQLQRMEVFDSLFNEYDGPVFAVRLWDGWRWVSHGRGNPVCTIVFYSLDAVRSLVARPSEITLGEAFLEKEIDVEGDIFSVFDVAEHIFRCPRSQRQRILEVISGVLFGLGNWREHGTSHSLERDRTAITYHYDQPVEFYRAWLGESLAYSCAYFESIDDSLDKAQENKLELICKKLRLQPGERFMDVGCGWGSLILHAASEHNVIAHGITISDKQAAIAAARIHQLRLDARCRAEILDYREAAAHLEPFDKIASVGMFEHVGLKNLPIYFHAIRKLLKPGGVFLNHGIARAPNQGNHGSSYLHHAVVPFLRGVLGLRDTCCDSFIDKYVFPNGELVTIPQAICAAESAGFEVRDVENLREHYDLTLRCWVEGLLKHADMLLQFVPERVFRIWLLYMAGSAAAFRRGDIAVYQTLLSSPERGRSGLPLRRDDWYASEVSSAREAMAH
jgi:cyclopropane-fatty-acyl-phospholipid synthase